MNAVTTSPKLHDCRDAFVAVLERLGAEDPKGGAVIHGPKFFEQPTCHWRPSVTGGVLAEESSVLLKDFFRARRKKRGPVE